MKRQDSFSTYHPIVNLVYFIFTIGYALAFTHPVCLGMSFIGAFVYSVLLRGYDGFRTNIKYMIPLILLTALINPAFSHQGVTILTYFPSGNPLTLESIMYGIMAAFMLVTVICWFSCFNCVISSDKMVYLFGKAAPVLSLILSMTLRFIPDISGQFGKVYRAQRASGYKPKGSHFVRIRTGCHVFSAVVTWALERAPRHCPPDCRILHWWQWRIPWLFPVPVAYCHPAFSRNGRISSSNPGSPFWLHSEAPP